MSVRFTIKSSLRLCATYQRRFTNINGVARQSTLLLIVTALLAH
jgi:hypothetical protein